MLQRKSKNCNFVATKKRRKLCVYFPPPYSVHDVFGTLVCMAWLFISFRFILLILLYHVHGLYFIYFNFIVKIIIITLNCICLCIGNCFHYVISRSFEIILFFLGCFLPLIAATTCSRKRKHTLTKMKVLCSQRVSSMQKNYSGKKGSNPSYFYNKSFALEWRVTPGGETFYLLVLST